MAQVDAFLDLQGITGESLDAIHTKQIEVLSMSWGVSNSGSAQSMSGSGSGKAQVHDLNITKMADAASTPLIQACVMGTHIPSGTLTLRKAGGSSALEYMVYKLTNVFVSGVSQSSTGPELHESVTLNFQAFTVTYASQDETGAQAASTPFGYDIAKNQQQSS